MRFNIGVQHLDSLIGRLRQCFETFPDKRRGMNITYPIADIAMAAFSVFFMQSPSFLAHQRHLQEGHGRSNCEGLFGIGKIPSDNHIRDMLDPAAPALLYPIFPAVLAELEQSGGLSAFRRLGDHVLIALDGSEYFCSNSISCPHCSTRLRGKSKDKGKDKDAGTTEYFHAMLGAALVAPGHNQVVPLEPEFISPQDGAKKQDCETRAVQPPPSQGQAAGWPNTAPNTPGATRSISATICTPASPPAKRFSRPAATSCSSANPTPIR